MRYPSSGFCLRWLFVVLLFVQGLRAEDQIIVQVVNPDQPLAKPVAITGPELEALLPDVKPVVELLKDKPEWNDFAPDSVYVSVEIQLGENKHVVKSWYPFFRDNPMFAVSETKGLVVVKDETEKREVEEANSAEYRTITALVEKVARVAVQLDPARKKAAAPDKKEPAPISGGATGLRKK